MVYFVPLVLIYTTNMKTIWIKNEIIINTIKDQLLLFSRSSNYVKNPEIEINIKASLCKRIILSLNKQ